MKNVFVRFTHAVLLILLLSALIVGCADPDPDSDSGSELAITTFSFEAAKNSALNADVTGTIDATNYTIALSVPYGTTVTALVATFTTTGSSVVIGSTTQVSGSTANDFTSSVTYTVMAADGTTRDYTVTVTISNASSAEITAFSFEAAKNSALNADVTGTIDATNYTIALSVPYGTTVTALVATFTTTGSSVVIGSTTQVSRYTANDFTSAVTYTATAADATTREYIVTVTISSATWVQDAYLKASNTGADDNFGYSVAVSGELIVVGAYQEANNSTAIDNTDNGSITEVSTAYTGAAYVFKKDGENWVQDAYLKASNTGVNDNFGYSVAISGELIVVGTYLEDNSSTAIDNSDNGSITDAGTASNSGAAYVFKKDGENWVQDAYLKASNAEADDFFGNSVAVSEGLIVVGGRGEGNSSTAIDNSDNGSITDAGTTSQSGAAYVFKKDGGNWVQDAYLKASNAGDSDWFGNSVAISGELIVVGALQEANSSTAIDNTDNGSITDAGTASQSGAAYVFKKDGGNWVQDAYLKASNTGVSDAFGRSVAVSGGLIVVGAHYEDNSSAAIDNTDNGSITDVGMASESGAAYVFKY